MPGQQQQSYHVQDEQGAHAIIGEALPHFRREQESQSTRVTEEVARFFAAPVPLLSRRENHVTSLRYVSRYRSEERRVGKEGRIRRSQALVIEDIHESEALSSLDYLF